MYLAKLKQARMMSKIWNATFDDGTPPAEPAPAAASATPPTEPAATPPAGEPKTFTQDQVNTMLANQKRTAANNLVTLQGELTALKGRDGINQETVDGLETTIATLKSQTMTKEEITKEQIAKSKAEYDSKLDVVSADRDAWKNHFESSTKLNDITQAAAANNAFSPEQITAILMPRTRLVEVFDNENKSTGQFQTRVDLPSVNDAGESVVLDLTPTEAVTRMKGDDGYYNLFKDESTSGMGRRQVSTSESAQDIAKLAQNDPAEYQRRRADGTLKFPTG